jgi:phosphatidylinositol-3-phosphatase
MIKKATAVVLLLILMAGAFTGVGASASYRRRPCRGTKPPQHWRHVVWVVLENHSYDQIMGSSAAPYLNRLARKCGLATNFHAMAHPSLPNYLAMTSGRTYGIHDDKPPSAHRLRGKSIFSQLGRDWRSLQESMPWRCALTSSRNYAVKHNPAAYYTRIRRACRKRDLPYGLGRRLDISARFTLVTPNLCHDMHDCSVTVGDAWVKKFMAKVLRTRQYRWGKTAVFVTFDEASGGSAGNHIPTIVVAPSVRRGQRSGAWLTHYSLLRATERMLNLGMLGRAAHARGMRRRFHLWIHKR